MNSISRHGVLILLLSAGPLLAQRDLYTVNGDKKGDDFGGAVSFVGDVDKDGFDDFVVGAVQQITTPTGNGFARIFSGKHARVLYEFHGDAALDFFGATASAAGDTNKDGYPDILVGSQSTFGSQVKGYAKLFAGKDGQLLQKFVGDAIGDDFGYSVSGAGDVNRDGYADVIVGARQGGTSPNGKGYARVFSGKDWSVLYTFRGTASGEEFGFSVSGAGDVNKDGYADVIVGARMAQKSGAATGAAVVFSGVDGKVLYTFYGDSTLDFFGQSVCGVGDVNKDGYDDVVVGAPWDDNNGDGSGSVRVFSGIDGKVLSTFDGDNIANYLGHSVCGAGDVDKDGYPDLIAGAWGHNSRSGCARVYSGQTGKVLFDFYGENTSMGVGYSVAGGGDLNGDGYPDVVVGIPYNNFNGSSSGSARGYSGIPILPYDVFGAGCASTSPRLPRIRAMDAPFVGKVFELEVRDLRPVRLGLMLFGISDKSWNGTPLPLDMSFFDMPGCNLLVSWDLQFPIWTGGGILEFALPLPDNSAATGVEFFNQCWVLDAKTNARGITTSNAGRGVIRSGS